MSNTKRIFDTIVKDIKSIYIDPSNGITILYDNKDYSIAKIYDYNVDKKYIYSHNGSVSIFSTILTTSNNAKFIERYDDYTNIKLIEIIYIDDYKALNTSSNIHIRIYDGEEDIYLYKGKCTYYYHDFDNYNNDDYNNEYNDDYNYDDYSNNNDHHNDNMLLAITDLNYYQI